MEMKISNNTLKNIFDGMKLLKFPSMKQEPIQLQSLYHESDYERLRHDYQKSIIGIRKEVDSFERRTQS